MANVIDFNTFKRGTVETTANIIKEEPIMNTIGTIGRQSTFANIGTKIVNSSTVEEALVEAGLNYEVHKTPIFTNNVLINGSYATCPTFDEGKTYGEAFGIVSDKYQVIQNNEAFSFIDCIPELEFKKMGTTKGGMIYFIGELPELNILGDSYNPYLIFRNSHNGRYNLQVTICPLRIELTVI